MSAAQHGNGGPIQNVRRRNSYESAVMARQHSCVAVADSMEARQRIATLREETAVLRRIRLGTKQWKTADLMAALRSHQKLAERSLFLQNMCGGERSCWRT